MLEPRFSSRVRALVSRFRRDSRGNIAVIFTIAVLPILAAVGCATDYSLKTRMQAKMQSAADAAAVASISQKSPGFVAAALMTGNGSVTAGVTDANDIFNGNMSAVAGFSNLVLTSTVTKTGITLASNIQFTATVPVVFMKVLGFQTLTVTGYSKATASLPPYLDFYLTLDVSGSMGLPSTSAEAVRMQSINPDNYIQYPTGCTLACHFSQPPVTQLQNSACIDPAPNTPGVLPNLPLLGSPPTPTQKYPTGNYCLGYEISRISQIAYQKLLSNHSNQLPAYKYTSANTQATQNPMPAAFYSTSALYPNDPVLTPASSCPTAGTDGCIQLRLDAVGYAVTQLFVTANNSEKVSNQFRIGLYPFIQYLYSYFPLTSSISPSSPINNAAQNLATLLDTNNNSNLGSGGTHIDTALNSMNSLIINVGDGSTSNNTLPFVFLVTDGAQDNQIKGVPNGGWSGSNHATVIDPINATVCSQLKSRGIVVSVLYIPYQQINPVNASFAGDEDDYANNNIPNIPASLQGCASPNFFFTANTPADIATALNAMFQQSLVTAHITN
jgi:Flp pilus assembly protein TadG